MSEIEIITDDDGNTGLYCQYCENEEIQYEGTYETFTASPVIPAGGGGLIADYKCLECGNQYRLSYRHRG